MYKKKDAVITVYLALVLATLLAMITSMLEQVRLETTQNYCRRVLQTAMESVLSDYYLPLFEHYQVFGLHMEEQTYAEKNTALSEKIMQFIKASEEPKENDLFSSILFGDSNLLLCDPETEEIACSEINLLTGENCFKKQAIMYEKYGITQKVIEMVIHQADSLEQTKQQTQLVQKGIETEEKLAQIDELILALIQEIEGVKVKNGAISQSWLLKKIQTQDYFVKQCITVNPTQSSVNINHEAIFKALKPRYKDFTKEIDQALLNADELYRGLEEEKEMEEEIKKIAKEEKWDSDMLNEALQQNHTFFANLTMMNYSFLYFKFDLLQIQKSIQNALAIIDEIESKRMLANGCVKEYKEAILDSSDVLEIQLIDEFGEQVRQMELYTDMENDSFGMIQDLSLMKESLIKDQQIISDVLAQCPDYIPEDLSKEQEFYSCMEYCREKLNSYCYDGLCFDYSGIQLQKQTNEILSFAKELIEDSITAFVFPKDKEISKAKLTGQELVSEEQEIGPFTELIDFGKGVVDFFDHCFSFIASPEDEITVAAQQLWDRAAYCQYMKEHTTTFQSTSYQKGQVLLYEREYLLYGALADEDNIESAAMTLICTRTGINYLAALMDTDMRNQAKSFALSIAGFTSLPFLVTFVTHMTLLIWAFEESLIETAALFIGKKVPGVKAGKDFTVKFQDILLLSKKEVQKKAKEYIEKKGQLLIGYDGYINAFLWMKSERIRSARMMDLIQENLRYEYEDTFRIKNCVVSFYAESTAGLKQKFLFLPYFSEWNSQHEKYGIISQQTVTY